MKGRKISIILLSSIIMIISGFLITATPINHLSKSLSDTNYASLNWAGYFTGALSYTNANAEWVVPSVSTSSSGYSSAWVGIGGVNGNGLIQTGTEQDCLSGITTGEKLYHGLISDSQNFDKSLNSKSSPSNKGGGCNPTYYAWWETYPANAEQPLFKVFPGDLMSASVVQSSLGIWEISISDLTHINSSIIPVSFVPDQSTAEAIIERPALCTAFSCKLTNLANFGTINFNDASANNAYFDSLQNNQIVMVDNSGKLMVSVGPLSNPGNFKSTWVRSN